MGITAIDQYWSVPELRDRMIDLVVDETPYVHRDGPCTVMIARLRSIVEWAAKEPCQHSDDEVYRCSDDMTLEREERCLPCCARVELDALSFRHATRT